MKSVIFYYFLLIAVIPTEEQVNETVSEAIDFNIPINNRPIEMQCALKNQMLAEHKKIEAEITDLSRRVSNFNKTSNQKAVVSAKVLNELSKLKEETAKLKARALKLEKLEDYLTPITPIRFHPRSGKNLRVTNDGRTVERINSNDLEQHGAITRCHLQLNELFELSFGSKTDYREIVLGFGVMTIHNAETYNFPYLMASEINGSWVMIADRVLHDGELVKDTAQNLENLKEGDRIGVMRKDDNSLHFFINGNDQGVAATDIPDGIYGFIDLYSGPDAFSIVDKSNV